ncbi:MAG: hypothetical protein AAGG11_20770 [Pseudomonadota bacterium]
MTLTTRFVSERELVYSPNALGFPSIGGCHAICYVTGAGLFGYHNYGGETKSQYEDRAKAFRTFINGHASGPAGGTALYGACFLSPKASGGSWRAYGIPGRDKWVAELQAFADAVGFTGPVYGIDLGKSPALADGWKGSAYVEFTKVSEKCVVQIKAWNEGDKSTGTNGDHVNIQYNASGAEIENQTGTTITNVTRNGVKTVYPEQLA